ncbi:MAG: DUF89 family protein, partial [Methanophagales archaeon]|nr:DUF89 family protein [Methanophagales archaeon]
MRLKSDCIVCLVERAKYECDMIFKDDDAKIAAMNEILRFLVSHLSDKGKGKGKGGGGTPAFFGTERERILKRRSGMIDPHEHVKRRSNEVAKELLPVAIDFFSSHHDGIEALVRIAAAANSMEYGVRGYSYDDAAFKADFMRVLRERLNWDRDLILSAIRERDRIVYLTDNAGEVFFDAFVVKELSEMGKEVVVSPKSAAVINDATVNDWKEAAAYVGVEDVEMIPSGASIGVSREDASAEFLRVFNDDDYLVIAKGMGNYESIS